MKNILIYCNTHYQIIIGLHIAKSFFSNDNINFIISDHSNNAEKYAENLKSFLGEDKVRFVVTKKFDNLKDNSFKRMFIAKNLILKKFPICDFPEEKYDEFITYNNTATTTVFVNYLVAKNPNIVISRMEEGILSYNNTIRSENGNIGLISKVKEFIKDKLGYNELYKREQNMYCTYPQLYKGNLKPIQIPKIDTNDKDFIEKISTIFGVARTKLSYPQKYIYFSSIHDFEGGEPVGELELCKKIANLVGRDNLLVKVHPRDNIRRFIDANLIVDINSSVPWEAIQLNYDFSNHVFLTAFSTSVLNISSIIKSPPKTYFLYKLINIEHNELAKMSICNINQIFSNIDVKDKVNFVNIPILLEDIFLYKCRGAK